jgi:hypothetical protein
MNRRQFLQGLTTHDSLNQGGADHDGREGHRFVVVGLAAAGTGMVETCLNSVVPARR